MRQSTLTLLIVLACSIYAAWFFTTHERFVRPEFTGYRGEARVNQFLAAELLLRQLGLEADSRSSLEPEDWLPDVSDTLVVRLSNTFSLGTPRDLLLQWVSDGGHLVLLPGITGTRMTDDFLDAFGLRLVATEPGDDDDSTGGGTEDSESDDADYVVDLGRTDYRIEVTDGQAPGATLSDDKGIVAVRREYDSGFVTLLASPVYFENDSLGEFDHARLLADVIDGYLGPGKVWFIYDAHFASLWEIIWQQAPYLVVGLAVLLLGWLWSAMPQFGPALRAEDPVRRSIVEHVAAAGHFVWRRHGARTLASSSANAVLREADKRHPGIGRMPPARQAERIARITGLSPRTVLGVIHNPGAPNHREFTRDMQLLQRIRKEL